MSDPLRNPPSLLRTQGLDLGDVLAFEDGSEIWMTGALCLRDTCERWTIARDHLGASVVLFDESQRAFAGVCQELLGEQKRIFAALPEVVESGTTILSRASRVPYRVVAEGDLKQYSGIDALFAEYTGSIGDLGARMWILRLKDLVWKISAAPALPFDRMEGALTQR